MIEFIPQAGACLASKNVRSGAGRIKWMVRDPSSNPVDNGWRIFSHIDTEEYLNTPGNMVITDFNEVCNIEPALIGIYDFPVGSDLQIVDDGEKIRIFDNLTREEIPPEAFYVPEAHRAPPAPPSAPAPAPAPERRWKWRKQK